MEQTVHSPSRTPDLDRVVTYTVGSYAGQRSKGRLRVWFDVRVVVLTELDDNDGPSITNSIESAAMAIERVLDVRFHGTSWRLVEHYEANRYGGHLPAAFSLVTFHLGADGHLERPEWIPVPDAMTWLKDALAAA